MVKVVKAKLYSASGEEKGEVKLNPAIFGVPVKPVVIQQVVTAILANRRLHIAHTKTRGEIRGGGRKPWRQKGTGRARHGSIRSPLWRGGGIIFGPRVERNFTKKVNKKMRRSALLMALSDKAQAGVIAVIDEIALTEAKTKALAALLRKINLEKSILCVLDKMNKNIGRAANNLVRVEVISAHSLNVYDLLKFKNILFTTAALAEMDKIYLKK